MFAPDKPYKVYCQPCWWSDKWDAAEYGMRYDPSRNFFEQFKELQQKVPLMGLINDYATLINSEYVNHAGYLKDCYLIFNADQDDNVLYSTSANYVKDSLDLYLVDESELCYEDVDCHKSFNVFFSEDCEDSHDVYFSKDLIGCHHCFGCANLRRKSYHVFNEPVTKEEYEKKIKEFRLDSFAAIEELKKQVRNFWRNSPHKFMRGTHNVNVSGDYVFESKNAHFMYQASYVEDGKFCQWINLKGVKDVYDYTEWGNSVEQIYDSITAGEGASRIKFTSGAWSSVLNVEYSMYAVSSSDIFGCVGIRNKKHCILNTQYSKEEFEDLKARIIQDMEERPYIDGQGRIWKYGEFFLYDLSMFDYNESSAAQFFPLSKKEVLDRGWRWSERNKNGYQITKNPGELSDSILEIEDSILREIIQCSSCKKAYRIISAELSLLRRFGLPVPRTCPDCRHRERLSRINPPRLWSRVCAKCGKEIATSYAPDRPEIVYCEQCYQAEVV